LRRFCGVTASTRLIDVCEKRLGYRHTLAMQWGGKVVAFKSFTCGPRHLAPHVTVNQLILDGPHLIEFAQVDQKFLFKSGLVRLRQLAEQISPNQIFALINFHRDAVIRNDPWTRSSAGECGQQSGRCACRALRASSRPVSDSILRHLLFFLDDSLSATDRSTKESFRSFTKMRPV
jgi:hypothetical protein